MTTSKSIYSSLIQFSLPSKKSTQPKPYNNKYSYLFPVIWDLVVKSDSETTTSQQIRVFGHSLITHKKSVTT